MEISGSTATASGLWSTDTVVPATGAADNRMVSTVPKLLAFPGLEFVTTPVPVSWSIATPVGPMQVEPQRPSVFGAGSNAPWVSSTTVTSLLPLFATKAKPSREITATPAGVVPTVIGEPIAPIAPAGIAVGPVGVFGDRATRETVPPAELVTTAKSRSVSTETPTGAVPTETGWMTSRSVTFETPLPGFCTWTA